VGWIAGAYRFCPYCGGALSRAQGAAMRQTCQVCAAQLYHAARSCASVVVVRSSDRAVLLVHRRIAPYRGWWDIPGGFVDYAELPAAAAVREAREETGLTVRLVALLGIWHGTYRRPQGLDRTLNHYFLASVDGGHESPGDDADQLAWFPLDTPPARLAFPDHARLAIDAAKHHVMNDR
jgi:8-oxo-dGTP diphosphatase